MPEKFTRKGALWHFCIFDILSEKQTVNGAIEIIDVSRESWIHCFDAGCRIKSKLVIEICQIESELSHIMSGIRRKTQVSKQLSLSWLDQLRERR